MWLLNDHYRQALSDHLGAHKIYPGLPTPDRAVVEGALLFGRRPLTVRSRVMAHGYGISVAAPWTPLLVSCSTHACVMVIMLMDMQRGDRGICIGSERRFNHTWYRW
jgi:hypothetical protein